MVFSFRFLASMTVKPMRLSPPDAVPCSAFYPHMVELYPPDALPAFARLTSSAKAADFAAPSTKSIAIAAIAVFRFNPPENKAA
jgi:hypothetical protein